MSQQPQQINVNRLNAIIAELTEQRNAAGNRAVALAGELAELKGLLQQYQAAEKAAKEAKAPNNEGNAPA